MSQLIYSGLNKKNLKNRTNIKRMNGVSISANTNLSVITNPILTNKSFNHNLTGDSEEDLVLKCEKLQKEKDELKLKSKNDEDENLRLIDENEKLKKEKIEIIKEKLEFEKNEELFKDELDKLRNENETIKLSESELMEKMGELGSAKRLIESKTNIIKDLNKKLDLCQEKYEELFDEFEKSRTENIEKNQIVSNLKYQLNMIQYDFAKQKEILENKDKCLKITKFENESLLNHLKDLAQKMRENEAQFCQKNLKLMNESKNSTMKVNFMRTESTENLECKSKISLVEISPISKQIADNISNLSNSDGRNQINFYLEAKNKTPTKSTNDTVLISEPTQTENKNVQISSNFNESKERSDLLVDSGLGSMQVVKKNNDHQISLYPNTSSPISIISSGTINRLKFERIGLVQENLTTQVPQNNFDKKEDCKNKSKPLYYIKLIIIILFCLLLVTFIYFFIRDKYIIEEIFYFFYSNFQIKSIGDVPVPH